MLQDRVRPSNPVQHRRQLLPVTPTLVIGIGRYGREVGRHLAIRLSITEAGLREKGLVRPLLAHINEKGETNYGLVRIMDLNWDRWFMHNFEPTYLLGDIEDAHLSMLDVETPAQVREEDRHPDDWLKARSELPKMRDQLLLVAQTLYMHNMPLQMGNYQTLGPDRNARLRICVVCAAREADTPQLVPDFLELLGQLYVLQNTLTKGLQVICYTGSTTRPEHLRAGGDSATYELLKQIEQDRILPLDHRVATPTGISPTASFLDGVANLWHKPGPSSIAICYLIDNEMSNNLHPVSRRLDEPDEAVVAAALTLNTFIAGNDDLKLASTVMPRWDNGTTYAETGPFATAGVSSCSLDYPQLPSLIYGNMVGVFLRRVQPVPSNQRLADIQHETQAYKKEVQNKIIWENIKVMLPELPFPSQRSSHYRMTIDDFLHASPDNRAQIKDLLEGFSIKQSFLSTQYSSLLGFLRSRQQLYIDALQKVLSEQHASILSGGDAALTKLLAFVPESMQILIAEAQKVNAPLTLVDVERHQQDFADKQSLLAQQALIKHISTVQHHLLQTPSYAGILGRSLVLTPLIMIAYLFISGTAAAGIPLLLGSLVLLLPVYACLMLLFRNIHWRNLAKPLQSIEQQYKRIIKELDYTAWSWALAHVIAETDALSQRLQILSSPNGFIEETCNALLSDQVQLQGQERVLERIFFDEELRQELKAAAYNPATLWNEHQRLLTILVQHPWRSQKELQEWLLDETQQLYSMDWHTMLDRIEQFLSQMATEQFVPLWGNLTGAAVPFLKFIPVSQDTAITSKKMLNIHKKKQLPQLTAMAQRAGVDVLESTDRARWLYLNITHGLHLKDILFPFIQP